MVDTRHLELVIMRRRMIAGPTWKKHLNLSTSEKFKKKLSLRGGDDDGTGDANHKYSTPGTGLQVHGLKTRRLIWTEAFSGAFLESSSLYSASSCG